jgi:hypothetical protein
MSVTTTTDEMISDLIEALRRAEEVAMNASLEIVTRKCWGASDLPAQKLAKIRLLPERIWQLRLEMEE